MLIKLYADTPNYRELTEVIDALRSGEVIIYPTSTGYAYACDALQARAVEKICDLKGIDPRRKSLSLMFTSLSQVAEYCRMNDRAFRFIREHRGEYTFILPAASSLPRILKSRKEVGVRLAQHPIARLLIDELGNPLITSSLPAEALEPEYTTDPELVDERFGARVRYVVDGGIVRGESSTIIDCTDEPFEVIRLGSGRLDADEPLLAQPD